MCLPDGRHIITKSKHPVPFVVEDADHQNHHEGCNCDFCYDMKMQLYGGDKRFNKEFRTKYHKAVLEIMLLLDGIWLDDDISS